MTPDPIQALVEAAREVGGQEITFEGCTVLAVPPECVDELRAALARVEETAAAKPWGYAIEWADGSRTPFTSRQYAEEVLWLHQGRGNLVVLGVRERLTGKVPS